MKSFTISTLIKIKKQAVPNISIVGNAKGTDCQSSGRRFDPHLSSPQNQGLAEKLVSFLLGRSSISHHFYASQVTG